MVELNKLNNKRVLFTEIIPFFYLFTLSLSFFDMGIKYQITCIISLVLLINSTGNFIHEYMED